MNLSLTPSMRIGVRMVSEAAGRFMLTATTFFVAIHPGPGFFGGHAAVLGALSFLVFLFNLGVDAWLLLEGVIVVNPDELVRAGSGCKRLVLCGDDATGLFGSAGAKPKPVLHRFGGGIDHRRGVGELGGPAPSVMGNAFIRGPLEERSI